MRYLVLLLALFAGSAHAVTIQWEPPKTRVDGTPLSANEISHYGMACVAEGLTPSDNYAGDYQIPASGETHAHKVTYADLLPEYGVYDCAMRTVDTDGLKSGWSNTVTLTWEPAPPGVPVNVLVIEVD